MAIISYNPDVAVKYVPKIDRKNITEKDVFYVDVKFMTLSKINIFRDQLARKIEGESLAVIAEAQRSTQKQQFLENVTGVHNYSIPGIEIKTPEDLYNFGESSVLEDILKAMEDMSLLSAGQKKN